MVTGRADGADGLLITRHLDYSLPYRVLLSGRGLRIPYLGERVLDALAGLLVRLHLGGFFWGDCSLSNTLFRRDADALAGVHHRRRDRRAASRRSATANAGSTCRSPPRTWPATCSTCRWAACSPTASIRWRPRSPSRPPTTALWQELTGVDEFNAMETFRVDQRLRRLHDLGFDAAELELVTTADGTPLRLVPRVVEHGFHTQRLRTLTGLRGRREPGTPAAQRHQPLRRGHRARAPASKITESMAAARWLDDRFEPTIAAIPHDLVDKLEPAELYHQVLEHRWFLSERAGGDVGMKETVESYVRDVLRPAPAEQVVVTSRRSAVTMELPVRRTATSESGGGLELGPDRGAVGVFASPARAALALLLGDERRLVDRGPAAPARSRSGR